MDTPNAVARPWGVQLPTEAGPVYYGPFSADDYSVAERFARFVSEEIDPAKVVPAAEGFRAGAEWRSPLVEFLNWRDRILEVTP